VIDVIRDGYVMDDGFWIRRMREKNRMNLVLGYSVFDGERSRSTKQPAALLIKM